MDGGAYGGGKAGAPFDPIAFVQRPQVILRAVCLVSRCSPANGIVANSRVITITAKSKKRDLSTRGMVIDFKRESRSSLPHSHACDGVLLIFREFQRYALCVMGLYGIRYRIGIYVFKIDPTICRIFTHFLLLDLASSSIRSMKCRIDWRRCPSV